VRIKIIAGTIAGVTGPVKDIVIQPQYLDCTVPKGKSYSHLTNPDHTAFIYLIDGTGIVNSTGVADRTLILFNAGDQFSIEARGSSLRFLLLTGRPLKEPIAWHGPIVMNTQAELETAFREYQEGTFVKR
jgi:hypothetical protein